MTTCERSPQTLFDLGGYQKSSREVIPANHFPWPASDEAWRMIASSGRKCSDLLTRSDLVSSWLRTLLVTSIWDSTAYWMTWKPSVTPQGRLLFQLRASTPFTPATVSGFLPTTEPAIADFMETFLPSMVSALQTWPTPTRDSATSRSKRYAQGGVSLSAVVTTYPTPLVSATGYSGHGYGPNLYDIVRTYPTVTVQDGENNGPPSQRRRNTPPLNTIPPEGATLSAEWTHALMGYPVDWCDLPS